MMTQDPEISALAANHPGWEIWRNRDGLLCAWWVGTLTVVYGATAAELCAAIEAEVPQ
jgi:hypothetical protein